LQNLHHTTDRYALDLQFLLVIKAQSHLLLNQLGYWWDQGCYRIPDPLIDLRCSGSPIPHTSVISYVLLDSFINRINLERISYKI
jgi:hypothetical protein